MATLIEDRQENTPGCNEITLSSSCLGLGFVVACADC